MGPHLHVRAKGTRRTETDSELQRGWRPPDGGARAEKVWGGREARRQLRNEQEAQGARHGVQPATQRQVGARLAAGSLRKSRAV